MKIIKWFVGGVAVGLLGLVLLAALIGGSSPSTTSAKAAPRHARKSPHLTRHQVLARIRHITTDKRWFALDDCLTAARLPVAPKDKFFGVIDGSGNGVGSVIYAGTAARAKRVAKQTGDFPIGNVVYAFDPSASDGQVSRMAGCLRRVYTP